MKDKKIRILHMEITETRGGIESFLYNVYKNIDRNVFQFDFITKYDNLALEKDINNLGGKIINVPNYEDGKYSAYYNEIKNTIVNGDYDIIHVHKNSAANIMPIKIAAKYNIPVIVHAHNGASSSVFVCMLSKMHRRKINQLATYKFTCSKLAAEWVFGKKGALDACLISNGINIEEFKFNQIVRTHIRKKYDLIDKFVIGNVGRFSHQKNHDAIIDIFYEIKKKRSNTKLILVGKGEREHFIKEKVQALGLDEDVLFLGLINNVNEIMQAMDVFLMPSFYEGLPFVGIEAQASGLQLVLSKDIAPEIEQTDLVHFLSLNSNMSEWADYILGIDYKYDRSEYATKMKNTVFDIKNTVVCIEEKYKMIVSNNN